MGTLDYVDARKRLVEWLRAQMIGPATGDNFIQEDPLKRYHVGVLSPITTTGHFEASEISQPYESTQDDFSYKRYYEAPSAVGFTLFVSHDAQLRIEASACRYKRMGSRDLRGRGFKKRSYQRLELEKFGKILNQPHSFHEKIWSERAGIALDAHLRKDGILCTISLCNERRVPQELRNPEENHLFETYLSCTVTAGQILPLPRPDVSMMTESEQELELQYMDRKIFAVGHGTAVDWQVISESVPQVWSEFMPTVEMPALQTNPQGDHDALDLKYICREDMRAVSASMRDFLIGYENWIIGQEKDSLELTEDWQKETATRMITRMKSTLERMRSGVDLLGKDKHVERAFRLANQAMLHQMQQADQVSGRDAHAKKYRWRSFQLAFLLTVLESVVQEKSNFRETMDLIWFPTGGGKTEAYLGLIAITIIWRRLKYGNLGGGTVAIMRYTLRLLTRQQFERAARIICALELIRRKNETNLGDAPINVGLWVGAAVTPNRYDEAQEKVNHLKNNRSERNSLVLTSCPWCGEKLKDNGYKSESNSFNFFCTNESGCDLGNSLPIPCQVVDHALYDAPPSLLLSTIDKFARLPWIDEPRSFFFGRHGNMRAPDLIIQDELHLVSGPLGSIAGVYEAGIDTIIKESGMAPKYIASTATINDARDQVQSLYARDVSIFPPPGISCDDMHFAHSDRQSPGRMYMGYLTPNLSRRRSMSPLITALIAAPNILFGRDQNFENLAEAWWTTIVFNRSLRDVSANHNTLLHDVQMMGERLIEKYRNHNDNNYLNRLHEIEDRLKNPRIGELTSKRSAQDCAVTFDELTNCRGNERCLDAVFATNMISVGLDVSRLALMVVNGQPQSTGEYIQVTSRVGRGQVPGLVVVNYHVSQARSLAHYENFRPFHESFHRFVETSSTTPFTYQVRRRTLHATLVVALRYLCHHLTCNRDASRVGEDTSQEQQIRNQLIQRFKLACTDPITQDKLEEHLNQLYQAWVDEAEKHKNGCRELRYYVPKNKHDADRLLKSAEDSNSGLWNTLNSMRDVEEHTKVKW